MCGKVSFKRQSSLLSKPSPLFRRSVPASFFRRESSCGFSSFKACRGKRSRSLASHKRSIGENMNSLCVNERQNGAKGDKYIFVTCDPDSSIQNRWGICVFRKPEKEKNPLKGFKRSATTCEASVRRETLIVHTNSETHTHRERKKERRFRRMQTFGLKRRHQRSQYEKKGATEWGTRGAKEKRRQPLSMSQFNLVSKYRHLQSVHEWITSALFSSLLAFFSSSRPTLPPVPDSFASFVGLQNSRRITVQFKLLEDHEVKRRDLSSLKGQRTRVGFWKVVTRSKRPESCGMVWYGVFVVWSHSYPHRLFQWMPSNEAKQKEHKSEILYRSSPTGKEIRLSAVGVKSHTQTHRDTYTGRTNLFWCLCQPVFSLSPELTWHTSPLCCPFHVSLCPMRVYVCVCIHLLCPLREAERERKENQDPPVSDEKRDGTWTKGHISNILTLMNANVLNTYSARPSLHPIRPSEHRNSEKNSENKKRGNTQSPDPCVRVWMWVDTVYVAYTDNKDIKVSCEKHMSFFVGLFLSCGCCLLHVYSFHDEKGKLCRED